MMWYMGNQNTSGKNNPDAKYDYEKAIKNY